MLKECKAEELEFNNLFIMADQDGLSTLCCHIGDLNTFFDSAIELGTVRTDGSFALYGPERQRTISVYKELLVKKVSLDPNC